MAGVVAFARYIEKRAQRLSGRAWVFRAVNDWIGSSQKRRYFLLTGAPGSGKTAISAQLTLFSSGARTPREELPHLHSGCLSAVHFCRAADRNWCISKVFAESLALQLAKRYPEFSRALIEKSSDGRISIEVKLDVTGGTGTGVAIQNLNINTPSADDAFSCAVREPLEALLTTRPELGVVILVDALDESLVYSNGADIVGLLAHLEGLPAQVRFLLTSRDADRVVNEFGGSDLVLSAPKFSESNYADLHEYVDTRWSDPADLGPQAHRLKAVESMRLRQLIARKGNFLYVRFALDAAATERGIARRDEPPAARAGRSLPGIPESGGQTWPQEMVSRSRAADGSAGRGRRRPHRAPVAELHPPPRIGCAGTSQRPAAVHRRCGSDSSDLSRISAGILRPAVGNG